MRTHIVGDTPGENLITFVSPKNSSSYENETFRDVFVGRLMTTHLPWWRGSVIFDILRRPTMTIQWGYLLSSGNLQEHHNPRHCTPSLQCWGDQHNPLTDGVMTRPKVSSVRIFIGGFSQHQYIPTTGSYPLFALLLEPAVNLEITMSRSPSIIPISSHILLTLHHAVQLLKTCMHPPPSRSCQRGNPWYTPWLMAM